MMGGGPLRGRGDKESGVGARVGGQSREGVS